MSTRMLLLVLAVIVIIGGAWWYFGDYSQNAAYQSQTSQAPAPLTQTQNVSPAQPQTPGTPNTVTVPVNGSSDTDLNAQANAIDQQMNGLDSDNASIDNGMNSQ